MRYKDNTPIIWCRSERPTLDGADVVVPLESDSHATAALAHTHKVVHDVCELITVYKGDAERELAFTVAQS